MFPVFRRRSSRPMLLSVKTKRDKKCPGIPVLKRMRGAFFGGSIGQYNAAVASIHGGKAAGGDSHNFPERGAVLQQGLLQPFRPGRAIAICQYQLGGNGSHGGGILQFDQFTSLFSAILFPRALDTILISPLPSSPRNGAEGENRSQNS